MWESLSLSGKLGKASPCLRIPAAEFRMSGATEKCGLVGLTFPSLFSLPQPQWHSLPPNRKSILTTFSLSFFFLPPVSFSFSLFFFDRVQRLTDSEPNKFLTAGMSESNFDAMNHLNKSECNVTMNNWKVVKLTVVPQIISDLASRFPLGRPQSL